MLQEWGRTTGQRHHETVSIDLAFHSGVRWRRAERMAVDITPCVSTAVVQPVLSEGPQRSLLSADFHFDQLVQLTCEVFIAISHRLGCGAAQIRNSEQMRLNFDHERLLL